MADYVDCDGDWVHRQPAVLENMTVFIFVLPARPGALEDLCKFLVNDRASGVSVAPLFPAVLLVCANIERARSTNSQDSRKGYLVEKDMGFFVPVVLTDDNSTSIGSLIPYLFVEPTAAVLAGREVYGIPKSHAYVTFDEDAPEFSARALVIDKYDRDSAAVMRRVLDVNATGPVLRTKVGGDLMEFSRSVTEKIWDVLSLSSLGTLNPSPPTGFTEFPVVLLKQFRDAANPQSASHQSIVRANFSGYRFQWGEFLTGIINVWVPRFDSLQIEKTLGLFDPLRLLGFEAFHPVLSVAMKLDVDLSVGNVRWTAAPVP